jgi:hypothetical protein
MCRECTGACFDHGRIRVNTNDTAHKESRDVSMRSGAGGYVLTTMMRSTLVTNTLL